MTIRKATRKEINENYKLFKNMIKENELYIKRDIERILNESSLHGEGLYLPAKLAFIMMAEGLFPFTEEHRKEFNKFLNKIKLK